jgi:hypothetical protein
MSEPTEAMCDAPRGLLLYVDCPPMGQRMTLGEHLDAGGYPAAGLTAEELAHAGPFSKAHRAAMVWRMMEAAARSGQVLRAWCARAPRGALIASTIRPTADEAWSQLRASVPDPDALHDMGWRVVPIICQVEHDNIPPEDRA